MTGERTDTHPDVTHDVRELVHQVFEAWSSEDPELVAARFHPDATFFDSVNGQFEGREAIKAFYARSLDAWDDQRSRATRVWVDGDTAACTWTMTGRMKGSKFGDKLAGRKARIDGMAWISFRDGLVVHDEEYFDRQAPMASLEGQGFVLPRHGE
ncbi:SgcJ/EcaC family oxidoreductase [Gordonia sp. HNM0687]|uniref:SgcJ/EcaC family oxidoreductase n=1 Tax=Gordonia mangrovi TaxID=2665643 RepID=A0A6L7GJF3_9ACTN|nr:nuclear transport factor 2 family protein [Gordonia mangrovi]MXP20024.1 SgcJ/EcaC family oxidoreductase [Gordonia mangrovi]UVF79360.1 nuclear transport factor 2 family protein [Gordonia mangrovi]